LVWGQIGVYSSDFAATAGAATDPHPVLGHSGTGQRRKVGDVGEIHPLFSQLLPTAGARLQGHRHVHWRFGDFFGTWSLAKREPTLSRLAAGTPRLLGAGPLGEGCGLALCPSFQFCIFGLQRLIAGGQLGDLVLQFANPIL
jgi:hypothetical protein